MAERLRTWLLDETTSYVSTLQELAVEIATLRQMQNTSKSGIENKAVMFSNSLKALVRKRNVAKNMEGVRNTALLLTRALIHLADTQVTIVRRFKEIDTRLQFLGAELEELQLETLRALTRLRANTQNGTWTAPVQKPRVGTYFSTASP